MRVPRVRGEKEEARKADEDFFLFLEKKEGRREECKRRSQNKKEGKRGIRASLTSNIFLISSAETGVRTNL